MKKKKAVKLLTFLSLSAGDLLYPIGSIKPIFKMVQVKGRDGLIYLTADVMDTLGIDYTIKEHTDKCWKNGYIVLRSKESPYLEDVYKKLYYEGRKIFDSYIFNQFDWQCIAIMYMSGGGLKASNKDGESAAEIILCKRTYEEVQWFKHQLLYKLGQETRLTKAGPTYIITIPDEFSEYFFDHIRPYMLPGYYHKLTQKSVP